MKIKGGTFEIRGYRKSHKTSRGVSEVQLLSLLLRVPLFAVTAME